MNIFEERQKEIEAKYFAKKKKATKIAIIASVCIILLYFWIKCFILITPGQVGVKINLLGDDKGIAPRVLGTGLHCIPPWKKIYRFPTFMQNHTWEGKNDEFNFQTSEGLSVTADIGISYHLDAGSIPVLFSEYRRGIDEITHIFLRNYIRDALNKTASKMKIEDLYSSEKQDFFEHVEKCLRGCVDSKGIIIDKIYLIGKFHLPETVVKALNLKIEAIQRAHQRENELKETQAEARMKIAQSEGIAESQLIKARAEAESNKLVMASINDRLIVLQAVQKWDGKLPVTYAGEITGLLKEVK
jgi:regulator of protease activity HflC (stomatin/prohibitin superfamily)